MTIRASVCETGGMVIGRGNWWNGNWQGKLVEWKLAGETGGMVIGRGNWWNGNWHGKLVEW
jgi:hypothetical protein